MVRHARHTEKDHKKQRDESLVMDILISANEQILSLIKYQKEIPEETLSEVELLKLLQSLGKDQTKDVC